MRHARRTSGHGLDDAIAPVDGPFADRVDARVGVRQAQRVHRHRPGSRCTVERQRRGHVVHLQGEAVRGECAEKIRGRRLDRQVFEAVLVSVRHGWRVACHGLHVAVAPGDGPFRDRRRRRHVAAQVEHVERAFVRGGIGAADGERRRRLDVDGERVGVEGVHVVGRGGEDRVSRVRAGRVYVRHAGRVACDDLWRAAVAPVDEPLIDWMRVLAGERERVGRAADRCRGASDCERQRDVIDDDVEAVDGVVSAVFVGRGGAGS